MLHRTFVAPIMDGDARRWASSPSRKAGREAILARRVIDATGDADIAHRAGAPHATRPREEMMAVSVMFHLAGVDKRAFVDGVAADPQTYERLGRQRRVEHRDRRARRTTCSPRSCTSRSGPAVEAGLIPADLTTLAGTWGAIHDSGELTYMNLVHLAGIDGTDPDDLTTGEIEGRRQAMHAHRGAARRTRPAVENARLRNFGMTLGVRDTRKIDAAYNMTEHDVREQGRFDDSIGIFPEFIDGYGILDPADDGRYFQLPYRNLLPKGVRNLLVAGRSIGRRPGVARRDPQHGLLRRPGPGRRRGRRDVVAPTAASSTRSTSWPCRASSPGRACVSPSRRQSSTHVAAMSLMVATHTPSWLST